MLRRLLAISCVLWVAILVVAGTWTPNNFLYKPSTGARGEAEKKTFENGLDQVDQRLGKEIWVGDPGRGTTLQSAVTGIGGNQAMLRIPAGTWSINANFTIPANVTLKPEQGAILSIATGVTLTINGSFEAGIYKVFSCAGTGQVSFASTSPQLSLGIYPDWWGWAPWHAEVAINAAINSTPTGYGGVILFCGTYPCSDEIVNNGRGRLTFKGERGSSRSYISQGGAGKNAFTITGPYAGQPVYQITFKGLFIGGNNTNGCGILFQDVAEIKVDDCYINGHGSHGIYFPATASATFNGYIEITRSWFGYNKGDGIRGISSATCTNLINSVVVSMCDIMSDDYTATRTGVNICGNNISIKEGTIQGFKYGIQLPGGAGAGYNIDNVYFEGSGTYDIYAGAIGPNNTGSIKNCRSTRPYNNIGVYGTTMGSFRGFQIGPNYFGSGSAKHYVFSDNSFMSSTIDLGQSTLDDITLPAMNSFNWWTLKTGGTIIQGPAIRTLTSDGTFSVLDSSAIITPSGASRNYNPTGTFLAGRKITVLNASGSQNLVFDSTGLNYTIPPNKSGSFVYNGSAWLREVPNIAASWTNATASRTLGTVYTNSSSTNTIMVMITVRCVTTSAGGNAYVQAFSDTAANPSTVASGIVGLQAGLLNEDNSYQLTFVVRPGEKYKVVASTTNGTCTLGNWTEMSF